MWAEATERSGDEGEPWLGRGVGMSWFSTGKPRFNKYEETKDFVFYSRDFVIAGDFYFIINYRGTLN
jgi:hypothetical protein